MSSRCSRCLAGLLALALTMTVLLPGHAPAVAEENRPTSLTGSLIATGLRLLQPLKLVEVNVSINVTMTPGISVIPPFQYPGAPAQDAKEIEKKLAELKE